MNFFKIILSTLFLTVSSASFASDFFDTSKPETPFGLGVRIGINASNQTRSSYNLASSLDGWGTGFTAGALFDLNIKNYLTIQPGFFFESRSNNYSYIYNTQNNSKTEFGHTRHYSFKIPILASLRFNPANSIRLHLDFGPYFSYGFAGSDNGSVINEYSFDDGYFDNRNKFDFGLKFGVGFKFMKHYYIGAHYQAGLLDVWKDNNLSGKHKAWTLSLGYDF